MLFGREEHANITTKKINREILDCNNDLATHPNTAKKRKKDEKKDEKKECKKGTIQMHTCLYETCVVTYVVCYNSARNTLAYVTKGLVTCLH